MSRFFALPALSAIWVLIILLAPTAALAEGNADRLEFNHDIRIQPEEQVYVLGTALEQSGAKELAENSARLYIGSNQDHEFIISDRSEKDLLSRLHWQMLAYGAGGLALAATCLIVIFKYYLTTVS